MYRLFGVRRRTAWPFGANQKTLQKRDRYRMLTRHQICQGAPRSSAKAPTRQEEAGRKTGSGQANQIGRDVTRIVKKQESLHPSRPTNIFCQATKIGQKSETILKKTDNIGQRWIAAQLHNRLQSSVRVATTPAVLHQT